MADKKIVSAQEMMQEAQSRVEHLLESYSIGRDEYKVDLRALSVVLLHSLTDTMKVVEVQRQQIEEVNRRLRAVEGGTKP